ncbi:NAD(P)-binding domain-containing protein [Poseidonocella sp. HB161398]|uniref:NAD(P)-binding domain-containing protein n=1 Tax=Poseidonocella sp. HB161398 TaxID=2320855 RepID=UPI001107AC0B|nr:NAD(P)/FAD-dependent oxidoreductase [Poseidonocella sp. HB161398]
MKTTSPVTTLDFAVPATDPSALANPWDAGAAESVHPAGLPGLEAELASQLARLCLPRKAWTVPRPGPDGTAMLDVLVIGAGQYGTGIGAALRMNGFANFLILDKAEEGREGPWVTYARMPTLRSPKFHPGICFGVPALTFQSWYRAAHGDTAWERLYKIPNGVWQDYLVWVRRVLALPVRNRAEAVDLRQAGDHVEVALADGSLLRARRVIVANGRIGSGGPALVPGVDPGLLPDLAAHTSDPIDFQALRGKRIAVIGTGSSAWDNAATALEHGAETVEMVARRKAVPQLNKGRPASGIAWMEGWQALPDADRWRLTWYMDSMGAPPPHETILRTTRMPGFSAHFSCGAMSATREGGKVRLATEHGPSGLYDFLILGTGFRTDLSQEPLFASIFPAITLWSDRYQPPADYAHPGLGRAPYIGPGYELIGKDGADLSRIHLFNNATYLSTGTMASDIPSLDIAPMRLVTGLVQQFFTEDFDGMFAELQDWEEEHEMKTTPFYAPEFVNQTGR